VERWTFVDGETERQARVTALAAVARGDQAALRRVYDQTSAKLFGVCLRILKDRAEAEDVLQDVYVTVWRRAGSFDSSRGVSPITWLATLARNRAIDRLRASKAHLSRPIDLVAETADIAPLADATLEQDQTQSRLAHCLEQLEPDHAGYVRSAFFGGYTYQTLAEAAAVPLGTMKSWIRRSLLRLRSCLDEGGAAL
jgi:RNA polymerase sigma-70 factor (ECF subfamily)